MIPSRDDLAQLAGRLGAKARELAARYPTGAGSAGPSSAPGGESGPAAAAEPARSARDSADGQLPPGDGDLAAVSTARELSVLATAALRMAVDLARPSGRTWQELGDVRRHPPGLVGRYEQMGGAAARQAGNLTIVDIPMSFEASEMRGRVVYDKDGKVTGLFVLQPDAI